VSAGLVKILTVFVRRPDLTRTAFRSHYENRHVPRAMEHVAHFGFRKYVRNHVVGPDGVEPGFDCLTEFFFRSLEDAGSSVGFMSSPEGRWFAEDELNFLDMSHHPSFELAENVVAGPPRGVDPKGLRKQALVLTRAPGKSAEEFARAAREHARALAVRHAGAIHRLMLDLAVQGPGREPPWDALLALWPADARARAEWLRWPDASDRAVFVELESLEEPPERLA
jgi:uncharacterized protein (TIGR02118 family)